MKKPVYVVFLFVILFVVSGCKEEDPGPSPLDEAYEMYSLFINEYVQGDVVLQNESSHGLAAFNIQEHYLDYAIENFPEINESLIRGLTQAGEDSIVYENKFDLNDKEITLVTGDDIASIFNNQMSYQEIWETFFETYGENAYRLGLTRVSFNEDRTKAVFCAAKGHWAYYGYMVYCEKVNGEWTIEELVNLWVT